MKLLDLSTQKLVSKENSLSFCISFFFAAEVNTMTKSDLWKKGFILVYGSGGPGSLMMRTHTASSRPRN